MNNFEELMKKEAFENLDKDKVSAFKELSQRLEGKNSTESMGIIMEFAKNMKRGEPLTKVEQDAMIDALMEVLPEEDKMKFKMVLKMISIG